MKKAGMKTMSSQIFTCYFIVEGRISISPEKRQDSETEDHKLYDIHLDNIKMDKQKETSEAKFKLFGPTTWRESTSLLSMKFW